MPSASVKLFVGLGVESVAFLQRVPEDLVAHHNRVDYARFIEGELILAEHAHFLGAVMEPLVGSSSAVRIFMNVDLPAPLGPVTA